MNNRKSDCQCEGVCNLEFCEQETIVASDQVTMLNSTNEIGLQDELLVIRKDGEQTQFYRARVEEFSSGAALYLLEKAVQSMSRTDPADGRSLWLNEGFVCLASGDVSRFGTVSPHGLSSALKEMFAMLPTQDPGDGSPWINGGFLMKGSVKQVCE